MDHRSDICLFWRALAAHQELVHYTEDQRRDDWLAFIAAVLEAVRTGDWSKVREIWTDCSGSFEMPYDAFGCPDPSGPAIHWGYLGYTGTLLAAGRHIPQADALPGDAMVCGPGTGSHVVGLLEPGTAHGGDPLVFSHGHEQGISPEIRRLSWDSRTPRTFLRFDTDDHKAPIAPPKPVVVAPAPPAAHAYAAAHGMVVIDVAEAKLAIHNKIRYFVWKNASMIGSLQTNVPNNVVLFANKSPLDAAKIPHAGA